MSNKFLQIAKEQFSKLKEEVLDDDRHSLGGGNEEEYQDEETGLKYTIKVDGFWEKSEWFDYEVYNEAKELIEKGTHY